MKNEGKLFNIQRFSINDGPGIRTTVFFKGCPLHCRWCSNPESQNRYADIADAIEDVAYRGRKYTVEEVMAEVVKDMPFYQQSGGGVTLSGGEVLQQADFAIALEKAAHKEGIHVAVETTGFAQTEKFMALIEHADLILMDFKHADSQVHEAQTGVPNELILQNFRKAVVIGKSIIARIPVIPGFNAKLQDAQLMAKALREIGIHQVNLLPFHQLGEKKYETLGVEYSMTGKKQLYPEMLEKYRQCFLDEGLDCSFA